MCVTASFIIVVLHGFFTRQYVPDLSRHVLMHHGHKLMLGKLDAYGIFHVERVVRGGGFTGPMPVFAYINVRPEGGGAVAEYRSGMLIYGTMSEEGHFVPDAGSRVTKFEDYVRSGSTIPIWNLPGYFRLVPKSISAAPRPKP